MIINGSHSRRLASGAAIQFLVRARWFFGLAMAVFFTVAATPPSIVSDEDTDQQFIHIMNLMDRADVLRASGKADAAKAKDEEAYRALVIFQKIHPRWYPKTVQYRLTEVTQDIEGKPAETSEPAATPKPHTNSEKPAKTGSSPTASSTSSVQLLDPGSEPRQVLRLHVKPGDKQAVVLTVKMSMDMPAMAGPRGVPQIPPLTVPADVSIDSVATNGDITFDAVLGEVSLAGAGGLPPQAVEAIKSTFDSVKGVTVTMMMSSQGSGRILNIKAPPDAPSNIGQGVDKIQQTISTMHTATPILVLPEEAVGSGAKWEVKTSVTTNGMVVGQTATYQLASVDGDHISVNKTVNFTVSGTPSTPGLTPAPMPLSSMEMKGKMTGTSSIDLSKLVPTQATADLQFGMNMGMKIANTNMPIAMKIAVNFNLEAH
jgi:hypothetical protein